MVAPLQKKWFRIEQATDGAILTCTEVDAKGRKGAHVRFYEDVDAAGAAAQAKAWHENRRAKARAYGRKRRGVLRASGKCIVCREPSAKATCAKCSSKNMERERAWIARGRERLAPAPTSAEVHARRRAAEAAGVARIKSKWGSQRAYDMSCTLKIFDSLTPPGEARAFRTWLCGKITERGGAKALAEYEATRTPRGKRAA